MLAFYKVLCFVNSFTFEGGSRVLKYAKSQYLPVELIFF